MPKIVISDTSTLILFHKINEFNLLSRVYGELITTPEIAEEFGEKLPDWIKIQPVSDKKYQDFLQTQVDYGEASAIALATQYDDVLLLLDDLKARKLATQLNFKITGTLGIIHKAKQMSIIDKVRPLIDKLLLTDFRVANNIVEEILKLNNEYCQALIE
jgi:predicted nucleic acid-binding protein